MCGDEGIICKDLQPTYAGVAYEKLRLNRFDGHPSVLANEIAAKEIVKTFQQSWLSEDSKE